MKLAVKDCLIRINELISLIEARGKRYRADSPDYYNFSFMEIKAKFGLKKGLREEKEVNL